MQKRKSVDRLLRFNLRIGRTLALLTAFTPALLAQNKQWVEQGPGPIINGQDVGLTNPTNPVSGATNAIATVAGDPTTVYVGTVNGGIWKTTNANAAVPTWMPLTDTQLPALSIRSLAVSPLDPKVIYAGTGSSSSYSDQGDPGFGVAKSIDGGKNWTVEAASTFTGTRIVSIVPTSATGVVLAAVHNQNPFGLFRSTDDAKTFTNLTSGGTSGLPQCGVSNIAGDPGFPHRFYAAAPPDFCLAGQTPGVYKSEDDGATWTAVNSGLVTTNSGVILLSVSKADSSVFAMVLNTDGTLGGVFRLLNQTGATWTQMDTPAATIFPGTQAGEQGAIVAHPTLAGVVFVGGDYHPQTNGCTDFGGNLLRGDATQPAGSQWTDIVCSGANGTAPHADSRALTFDSTGTSVLHGCDGGLFQMINPDSSATRKWLSFNGNIKPSEIHNIAYDPLSHVLLSGNQDTGNSFQLSSGSLIWTDISEGDGAVVAVDADQTAHAGSSIRYEGYTELQSFNRHSFGANNVEIGTATPLGLMIVSGPGSGQTIVNYDTTRQFTNPYVLNSINASRMLIGTSSLYESMDKGDTLTNLGTLGGPVTSMSYGSALNGTAFPDAFYVGAGSSIYHRVTIGSAPTILTTYPGAAPVALVMNPANYQNVYVVDSKGSVWGSIDEGVTWENHTADLLSKITQPKTIEFFDTPAATNGNTNGKKDASKLVIAVGGIGDVVNMHPELHDKTWSSLAQGLPHAYFYDLHYNAVCDVLSVGSLGRGAWTLASPFVGGSATNCPPAVASAATGAPPSPPEPARPPKAQGPKNK